MLTEQWQWQCRYVVYPLDRFVYRALVASGCCFYGYGSFETFTYNGILHLPLSSSGITSYVPQC